MARRFAVMMLIEIVGKIIVLIVVCCCSVCRVVVVLGCELQIVSKR